MQDAADSEDKQEELEVEARPPAAASVAEDSGGRTEMEPRSHALLILSFMAASEEEEEEAAAVVMAGEARRGEALQI